MKERTFEEGSWIQLKDRALFRLSGPDRVRYLNGQVSNDVSGPVNRRSIAACLCSLKGKVEALVWISGLEDVLWIDGQLDQRDEIFARLDRYLIADDCELEDVTGDYSLVHHFCSGGAGVRSARCRQEGHDIFLPAGAEIPYDEEKQITGEEFLEVQLLSGIPMAPNEISGDLFPAELGLDRWAVDFHKGCYLGQEVVSRIESVGRVKRFFGLSIAGGPVREGESLRREDEITGKATRAATALEKEIYIVPGLFGGKVEGSQLARSHAVEPLDPRRGALSKRD